MKAFLWIAAIGACALLSGCDESQPQQTAQAPAPIRATPPQETAAAQPTVPAPLPHRHHHHRERWTGEYARNDYSRTDFTQSVEAPYGYISASRVSGYRMGYGGPRGYGRAPRRGMTIAATMTGERLDPWGGYGVRCPY